MVQAEGALPAEEHSQGEIGAPGNGENKCADGQRPGCRQLWGQWALLPGQGHVQKYFTYGTYRSRLTFQKSPPPG